MLVFSQELEGFRLRSLPPTWLVSLTPEKEINSSYNLEEIFPFLESYLPSFEYHWKTKNMDLMVSDTWVETSDLGDEIPLEASATCIEETAFILLQNLGDKYEKQVELLQKIRNNLLAKKC